MSSHETELRVAAVHPSLPGHFPGHPVVPGVVLLDNVLHQAELWLGSSVRVRSLQQAKFMAPLLPEQDAHLTLTLSGDKLRFMIVRGETGIAQGEFIIGTSA